MGEDLEILTQGAWEVDPAKSNETPADSSSGLRSAVPVFCSSSVVLLTMRQTAAGDNLFIDSSNVAACWCSCLAAVAGGQLYVGHKT